MRNRADEQKNDRVTTEHQELYYDKSIMLYSQCVLEVNNKKAYHSIYYHLEFLKYRVNKELFVPSLFIGLLFVRKCLHRVKCI